MTIHSTRLLDQIGYSDSPIHRLDPRAKTAATLTFIVAVVSFPKYAIAPLIPFAIYPLAFAILGRIPIGVIIRRAAVLSPFAILIGIANPIFDKQLVEPIPGVELRAGWVSFASILLRFILTVSAALALIATTSFPRICQGLDAMKLPRPFIVQMLFLYRYLFVLAEEAVSMKRARDLRRFGRRRGLRARVAASLIGVLFVRTFDRAERVYQAMCARGFDGHVRLVRRLRFTLRDATFLFGTFIVCAILRFIPVVQLIGRWGESWL